MNEPTPPSPEEPPTPSGPPESWPIGCSGCTGCFTLPGGIICIVLGVVFLVAWHHENYDILEYARGARIEPPIDFSRPGIHRRQFSDTSVPRISLNLCFCEECGPDAPPPPDVWRRLRFDVTMKDSEGNALVSSEYRGGGVLEPVRGLQVVDLWKIRPEMVDRLNDETIQIEVDNLEVIEEMEGVPAALYFSQPEWETGGVPRLFGYLLQFLPGVALVGLGGIQLGGWAVVGRTEGRRVGSEEPERS